MGNIGYQNQREDEVGVKANYNSLTHYVGSLEAGMNENCPEYESLGLKKNGKYQQLNTNILQIENEYYSCVRPKPIIEPNKKPLESLLSNGIAYIELRSLDINPLLPLGMEEAQLHFLEAFLMFCLLKDSPIICTREQAAIDVNDYLVAHQGRKPNLMLKNNQKEVSLQNWGKEILKEISLCGALFEGKYPQEINQISKRIDAPESTPSGIIKAQMLAKKQGFFEYTNDFAKKYQQQFMQKEINQAHFEYLDAQAIISCQKQAEIERNDTLNFDDFLMQYFQ
jgi:glutamate--cysteine ligase